MSDWQDVEIKAQSQARIPEPGETISTLNGVEYAHANTVVIRHRANSDDPWQEFITDRDMFDSRYWHNLFNDEEESENEEDQEQVEDSEEDSEEDEVESDYSEYTVAELKDMLTSRGLETSGNKPELIDRLEDDDSN